MCRLPLVLYLVIGQLTQASGMQKKTYPPVRRLFCRLDSIGIAGSILLYAIKQHLRKTGLFRLPPRLHDSVERIGKYEFVAENPLILPDLL